MRRAQVLLEDDQERRLNELAARTGRSKSSLVREAVELLLEQEGERLKHPLLELIGQAGPLHLENASENHDRIIYGYPHGEPD